MGGSRLVCLHLYRLKSRYIKNHFLCLFQCSIFVYIILFPLRYIENQFLYLLFLVMFPVQSTNVKCRKRSTRNNNVTMWPIRSGCCPCFHIRQTQCVTVCVIVWEDSG
uniref:Uncharacterized protein n=1 Tax=Cacopsylla melanoneura TaxID=428564 RepID=A0A8D8TMM1_9HEMI